MSTESKVTTDHQRIKQWVEERGGSPARVKDTDKGNSSGVLRIDYPGYSGEETLENDYLGGILRGLLEKEYRCTDCDGPMCSYCVRERESVTVVCPTCVACGDQEVEQQEVEVS